jgi:hypothetical protein
MLAITKIKSSSPFASVETLHLSTGANLVLCGIISYQSEGLGMMLSWTIFGVMYVSMSDIGEDEMTQKKRQSIRHRMRILFAYLGAFLSIILLAHALVQLGLKS